MGQYDMQIGMNQTTELNVSVGISMMLNPRMLQTLKILNMPYTALLDTINEEAESNPILEVERRDTMIDYLKALSGTPVREKAARRGAEDDRDLEDYIKKGTDLTEHLNSQIGTMDIDEKTKEILGFLITNLDSNGYICNYDEVKSDASKEFGAEPDMIDKALKVLQTFEPDGIGARNARECLLIQIREYGMESGELKGILTRTVKDHLEDLAAGDFLKISSSLGITEDAAEKIGDFIRNNLDPVPGARFSSAAAPAIPSFLTKKNGGEYKVLNLESTYGPRLQLNDSYLKMLEDPKTDEQTVNYIREKIKNAKDLMEQIDKRNSTMIRIVEMIAAAQSGYLDKKSAFPAPFSQKKIADTLGLHPSTVSRAIAEKYIETPLGVLKLKSLCPREVLGATKQAISEAIEKIVDSEKDLSASGIKNKLGEKGIRIQRRTVSTYRKALTGPSKPEKKKDK